MVSQDQTKLLGAVLVGDNIEYDTLLQYALNGIDLPEHPESLILPASGCVAPGLGADALPMTATICSCHNVSKGDIIDVIDQGSCELSEIKSCTKASTGCGGCAALLKNVVWKSKKIFVNILPIPARSCFILYKWNKFAASMTC